MAGKIVIVYSNKGGVGKSFIARTIADYYDERGQRWGGFDADHSSGRFWSFYQARVALSDLRRPESLLPVVASAQGKDGLSLLDVPAAHGEELTAWLTQSGLLGRGRPAEVVLCLVITGERETVEFAVDAQAELAGKVTWLVVKNALKETPYRDWEGSKVRRRIRRTGAPEVEIPRLFPHTEEAVKVACLPFGEALAGARLNLIPRHRLFVWRRRAFAQLDTVRDILCTHRR
jgi:hypothetical protein